MKKIEPYQLCYINKTKNLKYFIFGREGNSTDSADFLLVTIFRKSEFCASEMWYLEKIRKEKTWKINRNIIFWSCRIGYFPSDKCKQHMQKHTCMQFFEIKQRKSRYFVCKNIRKPAVCKIFLLVQSKNSCFGCFFETLYCVVDLHVSQ